MTIFLLTQFLNNKDVHTDFLTLMIYETENWSFRIVMNNPFAERKENENILMEIEEEERNNILHQLNLTERSKIINLSERHCTQMMDLIHRSGFILKINMNSKNVLHILYSHIK